MCETGIGQLVAQLLIS